MDTTLTKLEFESMLFVRHLTLTAARRTGRDLDRSAYTILSCLDDGRAMSMGELSEVLSLDASTLSRQTTAMLRSKLLERIPDPDGGMARKYRSTSLGQARLREACAANISVLDEVTASWSPEQRDTLAQLLGRFNRGIEDLDHRPWPRPAALEIQI
ncbi:MarR family winged helix-turn-helix transcriptional regulator [Occultella kanbiaonis]|uniref:MarR family winged helix-turn-helix transcriptional regulator n=1 Tax=Occultella kanbiaonis TaxID=2675754 RepID=UPI0013CF6AED|nr:MarR family transcriptional regulator [Occultella kanbiaonis]